MIIDYKQIDRTYELYLWLSNIVSPKYENTPFVFDCIHELAGSLAETFTNMKEKYKSETAKNKIYLVIDRNWNEVLKIYHFPIILKEETGDDGTYTVIYKDECGGEQLGYIRGNVCQYIVKCVEV